MTYVVLGLIATNIIAVLVAVVFHQYAKRQKEAADGWKSVVDETVKRSDLVEATLNEEKRRLEKVIATVKQELRNAENDLAMCSTPDAVRARLNRLFP